MLKHVASPSTKTSGRVVLRLSGTSFVALRDHLAKDPEREQFAFLLATPMQTADGVLLLAGALFLPRPEDLWAQSATSVAPRADFQSLVYLTAQLTGAIILDVHTHVTDAPPTLSAVDWEVAEMNAGYIVRHLPAPTTLGLVVFNHLLTAHNAVIFEREQGAFVPISEIQTIGPGLEIHRSFAPAAALAPDERYARQQLVPGWNQDVLAGLRIGIVGLGGHGAQVLQALVALGVGASGWIAGVDPDVVEPSNLPRIPYATRDDVGQKKSDVAAAFVGRKNEAVMFYPHACSVTDPAALARLRACDVLFGCGDNDGVRLVLNDLSVRCGIPLIDLGADIQIGADVVEAGGQVRVVMPGTTACLACGGAFNPAQAALDLLDDADRAVYAQRGYVIGADVGPTPSVTVLNALVAQYAVTALLALLGSGPFRRWDCYLHADWLTGKTLCAAATRQPDCPVCGPQGVLWSGVEPQPVLSSTEPSWQPVGNVFDRPLSCEPGGTKGV